MKKLSSSDFPTELSVAVVVIVAPLLVEIDEGVADKNEVKISSPELEPFAIFSFPEAPVEIKQLLYLRRIFAVNLDLNRQI